MQLQQISELDLTFSVLKKQRQNKLYSRAKQEKYETYQTNLFGIRDNIIQRCEAEL